MHDLDQTLALAEMDFDGTFGELSDGESPFDESEEMELAAELLAVSDEAELDQFFGKLFGKVKKFARSSTGRALGGILKKVAGKALPIVGRIAGTAIGGPLGGAIGGKLAGFAGRAFGLELEGMSPEDQEFEVARRFVRLAGSAAQNAAAAPATASPMVAAQTAFNAAARRHAPGLVQLMGGGGGGAQRSGRWIRRGNKVILFGV